MNWQEYKSNLSEKYSKKETELIKKAFEFASEYHYGQKRLNGEKFINHPIAVSLELSKLKLNPQTIAAGLLHDIPDKNDTSPNTTAKKIKKEFGEEIAFLVKNLYQIEKIKYKGIEKDVESLRKMFMAMAQDIRVIIIKLIERLDDLKTLYVLPKNKQTRISKETLEIYAPVADRLGMGGLKLQLEDAAFGYAYPKEYQWILKETKEKLSEKEKYLKKVISLIKNELKKEKIPTEAIYYRVKHYYSLWKKLLRNNMDWDLIYDLMAVRIIVNSIENCYATLGIIHKLWKPLPGRIKDYIALPKQNGYQSLHTTVFCLNNKITEFQIRTPKMHEEAEFGIAAHWAWEMMGKPKQPKKIPLKKFYWITQLQEWQKKFYRNLTKKDFLESLKIDFFKDRVFVLTPKGDVIDLPEGATPIDFAYHIHSEIGNSMVGAKVNNKIVPFSYELASGDMVEILTQKNKKPSIKWLEFAKTSLARHHIKSFLKKSKTILPKEKQIKKVKMNIIAKNRMGILKDVSSLFSSFKINIGSFDTKESEGIYRYLKISFLPKNKEQVQKIATRLKNIKGVEEVSFNY